MILPGKYYPELLPEKSFLLLPAILAVLLMILSNFLYNKDDRYAIFAVTAWYLLISLYFILMFIDL